MIQADPYSTLALNDFGGADRKNTIATVDPIVVDNSAWVLATTANVTDHTARAAIGSSSGSFVFPGEYFSSTHRDTLRLEDGHRLRSRPVVRSKVAKDVAPDLVPIMGWMLP